jgi:hypothetical protein
MSRAFVLGNGVSRLEVDLDVLKREGKVYGCNALYRTFTPDVLVSTDTPIATAIQQSGYPVQNRMYTRKPIAGLGAHRVPQTYFGYSSGPIAAALAAMDQNIAVYLVGFDMGPIQSVTISLTMCMQTPNFTRKALPNLHFQVTGLDNWFK